jgi:hypothetical protein
MTNVYIYGISPMARAIGEYIQQEPKKYNLLGYTMLEEFCSASEVNGVKLLPFEKIKSSTPPW